MSSTLFEAIAEKSKELGYDDFGITSAKLDIRDIEFFQDWLGKKKHGDLAYLENEMRLDPELFFPGARSVILFITSYKQPKRAPIAGKGLIASYARGRDYHHLHRKRLKRFIEWLENVSGEKGIAKGFSDSSPVLEKAYAVQAGLGWFGKNTLLIHRKLGTYTLLSGAFTRLDLPTTGVSMRMPKCGSCTRCLDACPTGALQTPYQMEASRCLSYHLIESQKPVPQEIASKNPGYVFGCDICQDVCPHNVRPPLAVEAHFQESEGIGPYLDEENLELLEKNPERLFGTPLQRRKLSGLLYNYSLLNR